MALLGRETELLRELRAFTAERPAETDWDLREALRPNGPRRPWRRKTAPRCAVSAGEGGVFAAQYYDPHEQGARRKQGRQLALSSSFSGIIRNSKSKNKSKKNGNGDDDSQLQLQLEGSTILGSAAAGGSVKSSEGAGQGGEPRGGGEGEDGEDGEEQEEEEEEEVPSGGGGQPVRIEHALLETKFPRRREAAAPTTRWASSRWIKQDVYAQREQGSQRPQWKQTRLEEAGEAAAKAQQRDLGVAGLALGPTKPLSRAAHLEAAFDTIDTRASDGRLGVAGLQQLMASAGLPISNEAAEGMLEEAQVSAGGRGLTLGEFVRMLKVA
eukprot:COSAG05_NODE_3202_length_2248_cov_2.565845_1_plen_326_part_00